MTMLTIDSFLVQHFVSVNIIFIANLSLNYKFSSLFYVDLENFLVYIEVKTITLRIVTCGGIVVRPRTVLTAAQ